MSPRTPRPGSHRSHRPRRRGWMGWALVALGVLVAGTWAASGRWQALVVTGAGQVKVSSGRISVLVWNSEGEKLMREEMSDKPSGVYATKPGDRGWRWWFEWGNAGRFASRPLAEIRYVRVPLWALLVPIGGAGVWRWAALRRRVGRGGCAACGYDLRGLAAGSACPECGAAAVRADV